MVPFEEKAERVLLFGLEQLVAVPFEDGKVAVILLETLAYLGVYLFCVLLAEQAQVGLRVGHKNNPAALVMLGHHPHS